MEYEMRKQQIPNGMILHETHDIVIIITGLTKASTNIKTGDMAQIYTLIKNIKPTEAVKLNLDEPICGDCIHRRKRSCYVNAGQAPTAVWKAYKRGVYDPLNLPILAKALKWKAVRFGAYGEPVKLPIELVEFIADKCVTWTGYSHQWLGKEYQAYKDYFMASVETTQEYLLARAKGWRSYRVLAEDVTPRQGEIMCPNEKTGVQCRDCGLCDGMSGQHGKGRSITVKVHGNASRINNFNKALTLENV
jgi:hypothetical protein